MGSNVMLRRGLATGGGAAAVTMAGWFGEHAASRSTARVASQAMNNARCHLLSKQQQQTKFISSTTAASKPADAAAVPPPPAQSSSLSFVKWYEGHLDASPILTKSITGSILWGIGDFVAQFLPQLFFQSEEDENEEITYDFTRTGRAVLFGGLIHAPTSHVHFNFLEWMTVRTGLSGMGIPVFKTVMEQVSLLRTTLFACFFPLLVGLTDIEIQT